MSIQDPQDVVRRLIDFQAQVREVLIQARAAQNLSAVDRQSTADTIYGIDCLVEPILDAFCEDWGRTTPLVLIAEGVEDEQGQAGRRVYPRGSREEDARICLIVDPIDGTRGLMYDKRAAWALAGVAPNKGPGTRLRDIEVAVMSELPTSKMGRSDVCWAIKGQGAHAHRVDLTTGRTEPLVLRPSSASDITHGFSSVVSFFPGTKLVAAELMEFIARRLIGPADVSKALVFEDQYISTGGQFYEVIAGHDRFIADLRPLVYARDNRPQGLCAHPYDCCTALIAEEAGAIITDGLGHPLDGPLDVTTGLNWIAFANRTIHDQVQPLVREFFGLG